MTVTEPHDTLKHRLDLACESLTRRIQPLQRSSQRLAVLRLGILVGGILPAVVVGFIFGAVWGWSVFGVAFVLFLGAVIAHRRLDHRIETLTLWRAIKSDLRARLELEWDALPPPRPAQLRDLSLARDLDLTGYRSLHQLLDTTISSHGTKLVAEWISQTRPDVNALRGRQAIVRELRTRARFRERFQLQYRLVMKRELEGDILLDWLKTDFPSARLRRALPVAALLVAANLVLFALWQFAAFPPFFLASFVAYVAFYYRNQSALETVLGGVVRVNAELEKLRVPVQYLERASYHNAPQLAQLVAPFVTAVPRPSAQLRRVQLVTAGVGLRSNPLLAVLLNVILPWDFLFARLADRARGQVADTLPVWMGTIHQLDALIALANFAALHPEATFPEIDATAPVLRATQLGHPLIPYSQRVCNDFDIDALGQVDILTGSNMAGKSTFLKAIGINFCLAYAGAPVIASRFSAQPFRLHTCIRITDSIVDGFSYFYAEVKCLRALMEELQAADELPLFFLVDEIFRGTNNRERLIGSRAYIQTLLGARGAGLIATHDLELAQFANTDPHARNFHFRDDVSEGRLVFDYVLRAGPTPTTNALKIMELEGLPIRVFSLEGFARGETSQLDADVGAGHKSANDIRADIE